MDFLKNATLMCIIASVCAVVGIVIGILKPNLWILLIILMVPSVLYAIYRCTGVRTKAAAWAVLGLLVIEIVMIYGKVNVPIVKSLGINIIAVAPVLIVLLSIFLFQQTAGKFTKWLAVNILLCALAFFYLSQPVLFGKLIGKAKQGIEQKIDSKTQEMKEKAEDLKE
jgi:hypothetical protein